MKLAINTTFTDKAKQEQFSRVVKTFENVDATREELACLRPVNDQELLFHKQAVGDDSLGPARSK